MHMEIADGRVKNLADLLHKPPASPGPENQTRGEHPEAGIMEHSPPGMENYEASSSPEMAEMDPLEPHEMVRKSQESEDPMISVRRRSPTVSLEPEKAHSESTGSDFGDDLPEVGDGHQIKASFQRQSHGFDPPAYVQHMRSAPSQQKSMGFEGAIPIGGARSSVHPLEQIERSLPHKLTLQLWQDEERLLRMQIQAHESSCSHIEHQIHQIFGFYILFQGILIAGAAQASVLDCTTAWLPLILSIAVSLATFLAIFRELETLEKFNSQLLLEQSDAGVLLDYMERMKSLGDHFALSDLPHASSSTTKRREKKFLRATDRVLNAIWSYKFFVLLALLVFSILALVSFKKLLCSS